MSLKRCVAEGSATTLPEHHTLLELEPASEEPELKEPVIKPISISLVHT